MLAATGAEMLGPHLAAGLLLQCAKQFGQGRSRVGVPPGEVRTACPGAGRGCGAPRVPPEVTDGLEMKPPHHSRPRGREAHQRTQLAVVHARHYRRHQHHGQPCLCTALHGAHLLGKEGSAPQNAIGLVGEAVELQEHRRQPGGPEHLGVPFLGRQAKPVGVELHEGEPGGGRRGDDLGQVVPGGRLAS